MSEEKPYNFLEDLQWLLQYQDSIHKRNTFYNQPLLMGIGMKKLLDDVFRQLCPPRPPKRYPRKVKKQLKKTAWRNKIA